MDSKKSKEISNLINGPAGAKLRNLFFTDRNPPSIDFSRWASNVRQEERFWSRYGPRALESLVLIEDYNELTPPSQGDLANDLTKVHFIAPERFARDVIHALMNFGLVQVPKLTLKHIKKAQPKIFPIICGRLMQTDFEHFAIQEGCPKPTNSVQ